MKLSYMNPRRISILLLLFSFIHRFMYAKILLQKVLEDRTSDSTVVSIKLVDKY